MIGRSKRLNASRFGVTISRVFPVLRLRGARQLHTEASGSAPPDAFGPFRVLHQIGAGALGPVFRAYDPERDRLVAVKLFRLDIPPERVHQLAAEFDVLIAAGLSHSALVEPLAAGISGVSAYLGQEFVAADSLDAVVREHGSVLPADAIRRGRDLADALDAAAAADFLHGALHPRDVLVSSDGETRLTGLGIAGSLERIGVFSPLRRPYAAPERAAGLPWDRRADIFSLAVILREMMWSRRLNGTGDQAALGLTEIDGGDLDALRRVFARALADAPDQRFGTARDFIDALADACPRAGERSASVPLSSCEARLPLFAEAADTQALEMLEMEEDDDRLFDRARNEPSGDVLDPDPVLAERSPSIEPAVPDLPVIRSESTAVAAVRSLAESFAADDIAEGGGTDLEVASGDARPWLHAHDGYVPEAADRLSASTSVRPLALALVLGLAMGFAGGYALGYRAQPGQMATSISEVPANLAAPQTALASVTVLADVPPRVAPNRSAGRPDATPAAGSPPHSSADAIATERTVAPAPRSSSEPTVRAPAAAASGAAGHIVVRSTPSGARVFIDGRDVGRTPVTTRNLTRGDHDVRIAREGYTTVERRVTVTAVKPASSVTVALARTTSAAPMPTSEVTSERALGSLGVDSRPVGASVFVDGKLIGTTPLLLPSVEPGEHDVRLEREGYRHWNASVRVVAGERQRIAASLER